MCKCRFAGSAFNVLLLFQQSGQEFHEDLFPDTTGATAAMTAEEWWQGGNKQVGANFLTLRPQSAPKLHRGTGPGAGGWSVLLNRLKGGKNILWNMQTVL